MDCLYERSASACSLVRWSASAFVLFSASKIHICGFLFSIRTSAFPAQELFVVVFFLFSFHFIYSFSYLKVFLVRLVGGLVGWMVAVLLFGCAFWLACYLCCFIRFVYVSLIRSFLCCLFHFGRTFILTRSFYSIRKSRLFFSFGLVWFGVVFFFFRLFNKIAFARNSCELHDVISLFMNTEKARDLKWNVFFSLSFLYLFWWIYTQLAMCVQVSIYMSSSQSATLSTPYSGAFTYYKNAHIRCALNAYYSCHTCITLDTHSSSIDGTYIYYRAMCMCVLKFCSLNLRKALCFYITNTHTHTHIYGSMFISENTHGNHNDDMTRVSLS